MNVYRHCTPIQGKMIDVGGHVILLMLVILGPAATIDINPDLYKNTLRSHFGVNYKYNGMVKNSIDRVWAVVEVDVPTLSQVPQGHSAFDDTCSWASRGSSFNYLDLADLDQTIERVNEGKTIDLQIRKKEILLNVICRQAVPWLNFIKKKRLGHIEAIRDFFFNQVYIIFPELRPEPHTVIKRTKRGIGALLFTAATGLITLGVEAISTHLQNKRNKAINKALINMRAETERNRARISSLGSDFLVYGKYDTASTNKIIQTLGNMQERQTQLENLFIKGSFQDAKFRPGMNHTARSDLMMRRGTFKLNETPYGYFAITVVNFMLQAKEEYDN